MADKIINVPYVFRSNEFDLGEVIIDNKRVLSFISKDDSFPGHFTLYNWHELCSVVKVYFLKESDLEQSITGIALYGENLMVQICSCGYTKYIQASTPCPKWLIEKYINKE
ncbi:MULTISPECIES: hypothetical protein [Pseudobacteroides]|nr:hypothetical protein [Pseudobacteroides cellulosolvens]